MPEWLDIFLFKVKFGIFNMLPITVERYPGKKVDSSVLFEKVTFRNGMSMKNKFIKGPMSEGICTWTEDEKTRGYPNQAVLNVYERWGKGGFGMIIVGNIMVNPKSLELPGNAIVCHENWSYELASGLQKWASAMKQQGSLAIAQLGHCGRQTAVDSTLTFNYDPTTEFQPYEYIQMTLEEIQREVIDRFVFTAIKCKEAGFDGIQLNSAYGFLLSQFTSKKHNKRTDKYGCQSVATRVQIIADIVDAIRKKVSRGEKFLLGVKLNPMDYFYLGHEEGLKDAAEMSNYFEKLFDFVEYCGGVTEPTGIPLGALPPFVQNMLKFNMALQDKIRIIFKECKLFASGYRTVEGMVNAIKSRRTDGIIMARATTAEPDLPLKIKSGEVSSIYWNKLPPTDFMAQVDCSGSQILYMSKSPLQNERSLSNDIPQFFSKGAASKYAKQREAFLKTKKDRLNPVPAYVEYITDK